ncbi:hypothetical protein SAMN00790413_04519 [Deinococcus hopiensis KR-140]|uniref:Uncharacterized protein n=1 Tax=Deinococcus hopiensis KR-140 TaxID=695939 RepID=A0A1W1UJL9_9DEIO|nr:hypothetical protein SAMN00790413_04519 [Deinococcus hopiensis KR-140]
MSHCGRYGRCSREPRLPEEGQQGRDGEAGGSLLNAGRSGFAALLGFCAEFLGTVLEEEMIHGEFLSPVGTLVPRLSLWCPFPSPGTSGGWRIPASAG